MTSTAALPNVLAAEVDLLAGRWERWVAPDVDAGLRARALVIAGRPGEARDALTEPGVGSGSVQGLAAGVWAGSRVGAPGDVRDVWNRRIDDADGIGVLVEDDGVVLGPADLFRALLRLHDGDIDDALGLFAAAAAAGDARSPAWGARVRLEWARALATLAEVVDTPALVADERDRVLRSASMFFVAGGYVHLAMVATDLASTPAVTVRADPTLGHLLPGDRWSIGFGVQPAVDVRASKGLIALRHLVGNRSRAVPAVEIEAIVDGRLDDANQIVRQIGAVADGGSGAGADRAAAVLAERFRDDRARSSVSKLLHRSIERIGDQHVMLARHLRVTVHPGHLCRYTGSDRVAWQLT